MRWIAMLWLYLSHTQKCREGGGEGGREEEKKDVHGVGAISGPDDDDLPAVVESVHQG